MFPELFRIRLSDKHLWRAAGFPDAASRVGAFPCARGLPRESFMIWGVDYPGTCGQLLLLGLSLFRDNRGISSR